MALAEQIRAREAGRQPDIRGSDCPGIEDAVRGMAFIELADRWLLILNAFDEAGVDLCYEIHPGEDLHDGVTFERFLEATGNHPRCHILYDPSHFLLQQLDYVQFIDFYHERIKASHVKDTEFNPSGKAGVYGGYQGWVDRLTPWRVSGGDRGR